MTSVFPRILCATLLALSSLGTSAQLSAPTSSDGVERPTTWTDPTGLTWATRDNGKDVSWQDAVDYCANKQLSGMSGWRLPTYEELRSIVATPYDKVGELAGSIDEHPELYVKGPIRPSNNGLHKNFHWTSTDGGVIRGTPGKMAYSFPRRVGFSIEPSLNEYSENGRALCVHGSGNSAPLTVAVHAANPAMWTDPETGLVWARLYKDRGDVRSFKDAVKYCSKLTVEGLTAWRLPTLTEAHSIDLPGRTDSRTKGGIEFRGYGAQTVTSESRGSDVIVFMFGGSGQKEFPQAKSSESGGLGEVLCVHNPVK